VGSGAERLEAWVGGVKWAESGLLTPDSLSARLIASAPLAIAPHETTEVTIRAVTRAAGGPESYRLRMDASGIGVIQPASALLAINVLPWSGQEFPMWTEAGGFTATTLRESYSNFPNPFAAGRQATTFVYYLHTSGRVSIRILTPHGAPVATLIDHAPHAVGLHQLERWDGRNDRGETVYNGVYVAELEVSYDDGTHERVLRKLAVVR